jgi:peptidyl-tRNA hydrolase
VVRVERADPPDRLAALSAAAAASLAVLADPRAADEWRPALQAWLGSQIRKVARRARGAHWQAALGLAGVTVDRAGAQVRAFPPYPVDDTPAEIRRLQVGGTDLPDLAPPGLIGPGTPVLWLNPTATMTAGKAMAQVGHAAMLLATYCSPDTLSRWISDGLPVAVRPAPPTLWRQLTDGPADPALRWRERRTVCVQDAGYTEVAPGTVTVIADGSGL